MKADARWQDVSGRDLMMAIEAAEPIHVCMPFTRGGDALWLGTIPRKSGGSVAGFAARSRVLFAHWTRTDDDRNAAHLPARLHEGEPAAKACVADALRDAVFPRSKSVFTTVRETFTASATSGGS